MSLRLGNESEFVQFEFPARLRREPSEAPYEWNPVKIAVTVGAWKGSAINANLLSNEILGFLRDLPVLIKNLKGTARLASIEGWLDLSVSIDHLGKITISGSAKDAVDGN